MFRELLQFMDPKHLHWAREEAATLVRYKDMMMMVIMGMEMMNKRKMTKMMRTLKTNISPAPTGRHKPRWQY